MLQLKSNLVSVDWLFKNLDEENLVILNSTIQKVTNKSKEDKPENNQIKGAIFFDIKNEFSDKKSTYPNTVLNSKEFEKKAREIGINKNSIIICYDNLGVYSSPRVWWMFKLMGFNNIAVLNGGYPEWKSKNYPIEKTSKKISKNGNFKVNYKPEKLKYTKNILASIKENSNLIFDARSNERFYATVPEPRKEVKGGHIPKSISLPYSEILENGKLKSEEALKSIFKNLNPNNKELIFSCGTGITASILALGAEICGIKNHSVYDGSWTEWGSTNGLPIEI